MTTGSVDGRADSTRRQILKAASHQFARRPYHDVGLDDILAEAELTKGAMYFHFRSKHALAVAIVEGQREAGTVAVENLLARELSGLETLIDFSYLIAVLDIKADGVRAALNLLESVGRSEGLQERIVGDWMAALAGIAQQALAEGDIDQKCDARDVAQLMVSLHLGLRQTSDLADAKRFLLDLEKSWMLLLGGILRPDRMDYFSQFVRRRAALAVSSSAATRQPPPAGPEQPSSDK